MIGDGSPSTSRIRRAGAWRRIDFVRHKYGRELLVDAGWIHEYNTFILSDEPHQLSFYEILLVTRGRGRLWLDSTEHPVAPGTAFFTSPGQVRRWQARGVDGLCVFFTREFLTEVFHDALFVERLHFFGDAAAAFVRLPARDVAWLRSRLTDMLGELGALRVDSPDLLRAVLYEVLVQLNRRVADRGISFMTSRSANAAFHFRKLLEQHWARLHRVADYAKLLDMTPGHLNDLAHRHLGQSAGAVIRARLVTEARRRLLHSTAAVATIADELGFDDPAYFSRFFRRETGSSPEAFRHSIREKYRSRRG